MRVRTTNWDAVLASRPVSATAARDLTLGYSQDTLPVPAESATAAGGGSAAAVRFAERADFDDLMRLCAQVHAEDGLFGMSVDRVAAMLMKHFEAAGGIIGVIGAVGQLQGAIALHMTRAWYSDDWLLEEIFSYVRPEFRRSSNAKTLLQFGKACAEKVGVPLLASVVSSAATQGKRGLYDRAFGPPLGAYYIENRTSHA